RAIAAAHKASVAQIALAWLLSKRHVTSVILGASKEHQLADNLAAGSITLSDSEIAELDALSALPPGYPKWYQESGGDGMLVDMLQGKESKQKLPFGQRSGGETPAVLGRIG